MDSEVHSVSIAPAASLDSIVKLNRLNQCAGWRSWRWGDLLLSAAALQSQTPPAFDAAAIKPGVKDGSTGARLEGARYTAANYTLIGLLTIAYGMKPYQISGRPGLTNSSWIDSDRYTIVARMPDGADGDQRFRMLQALLADRFRLKIHREMTDLPAYALTVDKGGPKLKRKRSEGEAIGVDRLGRRGAPAAGAASGQYEYTAARIDFLAARGVTTSPCRGPRRQFPASKPDPPSLQP